MNFSESNHFNKTKGGISRDFNYSSYSEGLKEMSKNSHTESNSLKIGNNQEKVNVGDLNDKCHREAMANKNKANHQSNIFGDDHLRGAKPLNSRREGYNLITGEKYNDGGSKAPVAPRAPVQPKPAANEVHVQSVNKSTRGIAPVYTKTW